MSSELLPILPLNRLHLVFQTQLQLLEPNFLELFVFAELTFLGERIKGSGILHMLLGQLAKFVVSQERVIRSHHPADLQPGFNALKLSQHHNRFNAELWCSLVLRKI